MTNNVQVELSMGTVILRSPLGKEVNKALEDSFDIEHNKPNMIKFINVLTPLIIQSHPKGNVNNEHFVDSLEYADFMKLKTEVTNYIGSLNGAKKGE